MFCIVGKQKKNEGKSLRACKFAWGEKNVYCMKKRKQKINSEFIGRWKKKTLLKNLNKTHANTGIVMRILASSNRFLVKLLNCD